MSQSNLAKSVDTATCCNTLQHKATHHIHHLSVNTWMDEFIHTMIYIHIHIYVAISTYETCIASRVARFKNERNSALQLLSKELAQVTSAIKPGQECMIVFCFGKENDSSRRVILKIGLELNNLNSILSRSAVTPVFP